MAAPVSVNVEAVCQSVEEAEAAAAAGAGRIELVAALSTGGLTPSVGVLAEIKARLPALPVMAMVRPRPGGFVYSGSEKAVMLRDGDALIAAGADGLVFGALTTDAALDAGFLGALVAQCAEGRAAVCHRAFDLTSDPFTALDTLIALGFRRVLTSGQAPTALGGADLLRALRERAAGRIEVLAGGGVRASNVRELIARTGCDQVHLGPQVSVFDGSARNGTVDYGGYERLDASAVADVVRSLPAAMGSVAEPTRS